MPSRVKENKSNEYIDAKMWLVSPMSRPFAYISKVQLNKSTNSASCQQQEIPDNTEYIFVKLYKQNKYTTMYYISW